MSKLTRVLTVGAMLAAMHLVGTAAVAHANDPTSGQGARQAPTEGQVGEAWRHRQATSQQQTAADATLGRVLARERFSIPNPTPAQVPAPAPPKPHGPSVRLIAGLGGLVAALALAGGLGVLAARRTRRRARLGHVA